MIQPADSGTYQQLRYVHVALIAAKILLPPQHLLFLIRIFRSYGSNRGIDFTTSNPLGLCSNPINSDKYEVLMHKLALTHFQSHNGGTVPPNDYHLKEYLPIERQVRFVDITETSAEDTIWLVAWYTTMSSNALTPLEELQFRHRTIVHFRDPIN